MKNTIITFSMAFFLAGPVLAQSHFFKNVDVDNIASTHEKIGTLPFLAKVTLRPAQMEGLSPYQLDQLEKLEGESIQKAIFSWFQERENEGRLSVKVQDPDISNFKLAEAGITRENYASFSPSQLASILGVDAVVMGNFETNHPIAEITETFFTPVLGNGAETNLAVINLYIYNAEDGKLLMQYQNVIAGNKESVNVDLVQALMKKVSKRMVYIKI